MNRPIPSKHYIESDILLVHKDKGVSSFDVIRKLRRITGIRKIGHAGTLDPLATGLMIVGIETGTKKLTNYLKFPKTYTAEIRVGMSTTTGDLEGETVNEKHLYVSDMRLADIEQTVLDMKGSHTLKVPLYSAIKVQGKALYAYARAEETPPYIPEKEMTINSIQLLDHYRSGKYYIVRVKLNVSSGSYIRTLGEEFGRRVGYPATLQKLHRDSIGEHLNTQAYKFPGKKSKYLGIVRAIMKLLFGNNSTE